MPIFSLPLILWEPIEGRSAQDSRVDLVNPLTSLFLSVATVLMWNLLAHVLNVGRFAQSVASFFPFWWLCVCMNTRNTRNMADQPNGSPALVSVNDDVDFNSSSTGARHGSGRTHIPVDCVACLRCRVDCFNALCQKFPIDSLPLPLFSGTWR